MERNENIVARNPPKTFEEFFEDSCYSAENNLTNLRYYFSIFEEEILALSRNDLKVIKWLLDGAAQELYVLRGYIGRALAEKKADKD